MRIKRHFFSLCSVATLAAGAGTAYAQNFPAKPVRIVASEAGGVGDVVARLIAQGISGNWGQQIIIDNRAQTLGAEAVMKAAPDGYTLLLASSTFTIGSQLRATSYDPVTDFTPVTLASRAPALLLVHPSLPAKSVRELIALAKARPGELNFGTGPAGGAGHLSTEFLKSMAGINIVRIPFRGDGPTTTALLSGQVQGAFMNMGSVMPQVKSGRLRVLGVGSAQPTPLLPGVPTIASGGLPGFESVSLMVLVAPAKTPAAIVSRLNQETVRAVNLPDVKEKLAAIGVEAVGSTPEQLTIAMKSQIAQAAKIIKEANIKVD